MLRRVRPILLVAGVAFLLPCCRAGAKEGAFTANVVGVKDGDTIVVLRDKEQIVIRLQGVDAPEKTQAFGQKAKELTSDMVAGKDVTGRPVAKDRYGRTVAFIDIGGHSLNEALVEAGLAWHYRQYDKTKRLDDLESAARDAKRGLWADANPTAPWEFRRAPKAAATPPAPAPPPPPAPPPAAGPLHGNVKSHVVHAPGCKEYDCRNCTALFSTVDQAVKAGYRPHKDCVH